MPLRLRPGPTGRARRRPSALTRAEGRYEDLGVVPRTKTGPPLSSCVVQPPHKNKKKEGGGKRQKRRKPQLQNHFREIGKGPQKKQAVPRKPEIWGYLTEPLKSLTRTKWQQKNANQNRRKKNNKKRQRETPNRKEMALLQRVRVCVCVCAC